MRKHLLPLIILLAMLMVQPLHAGAITPLETNRKCSLKVHYVKDDYHFSDLKTQIYRVAEANSDGTFDLIAPFSNFAVNIHGIKSQREWKDAATTLLSHIVDGKILPDYTTVSDVQGTSSFTDLPTGLYLVLGNTAENDSGIYSFEDFFVYLPTPLEGSGFSYDMEARPKPGDFLPKTEYTVKKLWKDSGYTSKRPKSVTVDIYRDSVLYETVTLDSSNDWTYRWQTPEDSSKWTVTEKDVPNGYTVTVSSSENVFSITNSIQSDPGSPPKTGDTFPIWHYVITMSFSGFLLLILGAWRKRKSQ